MFRSPSSYRRRSGGAAFLAVVSVAGLLVLGYLAFCWVTMLGVGNLHAWWPTIPAIGWTTTLKTMFPFWMLVVVWFGSSSSK